MALVTYTRYVRRGIFAVLDRADTVVRICLLMILGRMVLADRFAFRFAADRIYLFVADRSIAARHVTARRRFIFFSLVRLFAFEISLTLPLLCFLSHARNLLEI